MYPKMKLCIVLSFIICVNAQRTRDKMYEPIDGISACFRRLNGTHQIGCSSAREGSTGILHFVEKPSDLDFVLTVINGLAYIPVIPISMFNKALNTKLQSSVHVTGLLVYKLNSTTKDKEYYNPDQQCPNRGSNVPGTCQKSWNPLGNSFLLENFKFPVFYIDKEEQIDKVRGCFNKFNNFSFNEHGQRSLCSVELKSFMFAAFNTPTCLRRSHSAVNMNPVKYCDPLGDQNVWASLFPIGNSSLTPEAIVREDIKQIMVVARVDATSLFHNLEPGAQSAVTSLVTLLNVAELLKRMLPTYKNYDRNVLFVLFNGESFDYIGSQRIVYDIKRGVFPRKEYRSEEEHSKPVRFDDIDRVFEISQISRSAKLHLHMMNESEHHDFLNIIQKHLHVEIHTDGIPPTSIQSFVRANSPPPSLVLTDYAAKFSNQFYNSIFDDVDNIHFKYHNMSDANDVGVLPSDSIQIHIGTVADGIAKTLYEAVTKNAYNGNESTNLYYVNELLHCYLESANCSVHRALRKGNFQPVPLSLYVSVVDSPNIVTNLLALTFAFFMGDRVGQGACPANLSSHVYYHFNMSESVTRRNETACYRVSMNLTDAESPAFLIDGYDWASGDYSTWTESVWREFNVRMFLQPARAHEILTLSLGIIVFVLSISATLFINGRKDVLFGEITTTTL